jgi:hypothetical protein
METILPLCHYYLGEWELTVRYTSDWERVWRSGPTSHGTSQRLRESSCTKPQLLLSSQPAYNDGDEDQLPDRIRVVPNQSYHSRYFLVLVLRTYYYRVDHFKECSGYMCVTARECSCSRQVESYDSPYKSYVIMLHNCQT